MSISEQTRKFLWGRSGNRCAFPGCDQPLTQNAAASESVVVGEEAHIIGRSDNGPRGRAESPANERDRVSNLILLCPLHHTLVDGDPVTFSADALRAMKRTHERDVEAALSHTVDPELVRTAWLRATLEEWVERAALERWPDVMSPLTWLPRPSIARSEFCRLEDLRLWLQTRCWPDRAEPLTLAVVNFLAVLDDLLAIFDSSVRFSDQEILITHLRYKDLDRWEPRTYRRLLDADRCNVAAIRNLTYELTRAGNFICDVARSALDPRFRIDRPALTLQRTPYPDLLLETRRPEYRSEERTTTPYPGFERFRKSGHRRDFWINDFEI